ncbi:glycoside hydrolase family 78 protein [Paenibacillus lactis]|uniref:glycoside hydrolase family 78 protein n=1 Tax=Paenibacillus lactis TaxID=228574 RepID=UPI00203E32F6|nr:glycoside hydrolase family 78 protein [Paenibacillus lactis]MCM3494963.1 glycoside hydrolase family 78 protein [Paenibacillus lactis]
MLEVTDLRCEYWHNPIGIGERHPRLSWRLQSDKRAVSQKAYELEVAEDEQFTIPCWKSGKVDSAQSVHVELSNFEAVSCKRYYYRVRVWDQEGECSEWSETSYWEMGKLEGDAWDGQWIAAPLALIPEDSTQLPLLRRDFRLEAAVKEARVYATSLGLYELEMNGQRVGDRYFTPGWTSYTHTIQTQTFDVTRMLKQGSNAMGAWLGNGWYKGNLGWQGGRNIYGSRLALLLELHVVYEDGRKEIIGTDSSWMAAPGPILMSELYHGETYDARLEIPAWSTGDDENGGWQAAEVIDHGYDMLKPQINEPVRAIETIRPVQVVTTPEGDTVLDFGQNLVGWVRFRVAGPAGTLVTLQHAEVLDADGNFYTENLRTAKQTISYTLKGEGTETYAPRFTFQGFRYVRLAGFPEPIDMEAFEAVVLHTDMEETGTFRCSEPLVNQLQSNIRWGLKGNFLDIPTDCPQRDERLGWTGDAQMFIRTAAFLSNTAPFFTKWLSDLAHDQREDGAVPFVVPNILGDSFGSAAWGDAAVICPWTVYVSYGDGRILERQYESMKQWVSYIQAQGEQEFLWNTGFHFGDWLGLDAKSGDYVGATERDIIASAYYAYSVDLLQKTAVVLGKEDDARKYADLRSNVVKAFREEFVTPAGRLAASTQTAHVLAIFFNLLDEPAEKRAAAKLHRLLEESKFHLTTGFVGTPYISHALSKHGMHEAAYKLLLQQDFPSWLYPVTKGATTIWEHWDGIKEDGSFWSSDMNSFNHYAYGAIGDWLYRTVAGIQTVEASPGYKHMVIAPIPGPGLTWAEGSINTMYGPVRSFWRLEEADGLMKVEVTIPPNATAEVRLPGTTDPASITEGGGVPLSQAAGILSISAGEEDVVVQAGSGEYSFQYKYRLQVS